MYLKVPTKRTWVEQGKGLAIQPRLVIVCHSNHRANMVLDCCEAVHDLGQRARSSKRVQVQQQVTTAHLFSRTAAPRFDNRALLPRKLEMRPHPHTRRK